MCWCDAGEKYARTVSPLLWGTGEGDVGAVLLCAQQNCYHDQRIHVTSRMDVRDGERSRAFVMRAPAQTCNFSVIQPRQARPQRGWMFYIIQCMCRLVHMYWQEGVMYTLGGRLFYK